MLLTAYRFSVQRIGTQHAFTLPSGLSFKVTLIVRHRGETKASTMHLSHRAGAAARAFTLSVAWAASPLSLSLAWAAAPPPPLQAPQVITWSDAQIQAAGVRTQKLSAAISASAGLVLPGTVELPPQATELLSAPLAGVVQQVLVYPGQRINAGEPVARLLSPELLTWQRELLQAQSQARLASTKLERDEQLHAEGIISKLRLQDTRAQHEQAQWAVQERRQALRLVGMDMANAQLQPQMTLRAAVAGTVLEVTAVPGQRLDAGMPVAKIARSGQLVIALQATPEQAQRLRVGDPLTLPGCKARARLTAISPQVSASNQSVQVRADFTAAEDCLRVQQFVQAVVGARAGDAATPAGLALPVQSVVRQDGRAYVFVRTPQGFLASPVELGPENGPQVQVRSGLKGGEEVAVSGTAALKGAWMGLGSGEPQ